MNYLKDARGYLWRKKFIDGKGDRAERRRSWRAKAKMLKIL